MKPTLSIIIPCFNCVKTLEEAVDSCYDQGLSEPFEIVLVDDASTDDTKSVMKELKEKHPEIEIYFHEKNKGGGATRNTAVSKSKADVIFCLDSDDILGQGTLGKMLSFMREKKCDAIGIHYSRKFNGTNKESVSTITEMSHAGERIPFENLFDGKMCSLYSTFMFTKDSFTKVGGYPTHHGFDTQGFAVRYLSHGMAAYVCPDSTYLHRINFHKSYYLREYESGKANNNWLLILEEILHLLSPRAATNLLSFDIHSDKNVYDFFVGMQDKYTESYKAMISAEARTSYIQKVEATGAKDPKDAYWLGMIHATNNDRRKSAPYFLKAIQLGYTFTRAYFKLFDALAYKEGADTHLIARELSTYASFRARGAGLPFHQRAWRYIVKQLHKYVRKTA